MKNDYTLAYSTCPNDTFIFNAIANDAIPTGELHFDVTLADVETLNQNARKGKFDITKLSFAAFGSIRDQYALLRTGAALGRGCGPLVVSLPGKSFGALEDANSVDKTKPIVAIPGMGTTAFVLFSLFLKDQFPGVEPEIIAMPFEKIIPSIKQKQADFGVIIHEGRFIYKEIGLESLVDLGQWWEEKTSLPIPLGCIAVKRSLGQKMAETIEELIGQSIDHAMAHPEAGKTYIRQHAQELDDDVIQEHINLYVNDFSRNIGEEGEAAIKTFYKKSVEAGLMEESQLPIFAY